MKKLAAAMFVASAFAAQANTISTAVSVGAGEVEYWQFSYGELFPPGSVTAFTVGATTAFSEDPHLCVFSGSVSAGNLVGCDDDSGPGSNATLSFSTPGFTGSYVIALSGFRLTVADALAGTNPDGAAFVSTLTVSSPGVSIFSNPVVYNLTQVDGPNAVPLPGSVLLLGAGLTGLAFLRRRQST